MSELGLCMSELGPCMSELGLSMSELRLGTRELGTGWRMRLTLLRPMQVHGAAQTRVCGHPGPPGRS